MTQVLHVLQDSTIASKSDKDNRSRFWRMYKRVAEEHDSEFLERYISDMDSVLVFVRLASSSLTRFEIDYFISLVYSPPSARLLSLRCSPVLVPTPATPRMLFSHKSFKSDLATSLQSLQYRHLLGPRPR